MLLKTIKFEAKKPATRSFAGFDGSGSNALELRIQKVELRPGGAAFFFDKICCKRRRTTLESPRTLTL